MPRPPLSLPSPDYDAVIVGGGPAGLACALWLARYRRRVCVFDTGDPRNRPAWAVHGFPGIDDPPPLELRARIRQQAVDAGAEIRIAAITGVSGDKDHFTLNVADNPGVTARRVVLAYGLRDFVPDVPGVDAFYGHSVYHCPDCDGPSVRDQIVGVLGHDRHAAALALYLLTWAEKVVLLTNGERADLPDDGKRMLHEYSIDIVEEKVESLTGEKGCLEQVTFASGARHLDALFFHLGSEPRCPFAADSGCNVDDAGYIDVDRGQQTSVPGMYAAGDIAGHPHLAVSAAAEGVRAALAIHRSLLPDAFFVN